MAAPTRLKELISSFLVFDDKCDSKTSLDESKKDAAGNNGSNFSPTQPRNRQAFFNRVKTFSYMTWFGKPSYLSPLQCARYGWENVGPDSLKCVTCQTIYCAKILTTSDSEQISNNYKQIQESLKSGHSKLCPWQVNPCPDYFLNIPILDHESAKENFESRFVTLYKLNKNFPKLEQTIHDELNLDISIAEKLKEKIKTMWKHLKNSSTAEPDEKTVDVLTILLITGWGSQVSPNNQVLFCELCTREVGLWNFVNLDEHETSKKFENKDSEETIEEETEEPPNKKSCLDSLDKITFNPLGQHREWCPWISNNKLTSCSLNLSTEMPETEEEIDKALPGWKLFLKLLILRTVDKQIPVSRQGMKSIRKLLKSLTEPIVKEDSSEK